MISQHPTPRGMFIHYIDRPIEQWPSSVIVIVAIILSVEVGDWWVFVHGRRWTDVGGFWNTGQMSGIMRAQPANFEFFLISVMKPSLVVGAGFFWRVGGWLLRVVAHHGHGRL
jgi:hypothetical protein